MIKTILPALCIALSLSACDQYEPKAVGQLISDRVELVADTNEPIVNIFALEGEQVSVAQNILQQDSTRIDVAIIEAQAAIAGIEAVLTEQLNGPRQVTIEVAKAAMNEAQVELKFAEQELTRLQSLREQDFTSQESLDFANNQLDSSIARFDYTRAQLREIEAGTRIEQVDQTRQTLAQAQARLANIMIDKERATLTSPVVATLDSLPFEIGERPHMGDVVAVLLIGAQPHARVYIPEEWRIGIQAGDAVSLMIDGLASPLQGTVRRIASEASFTPYFALTENDRGRLSFVAEITLEDLPNRLPEGMPVELIMDQGAVQ